VRIAHIAPVATTIPPPKSGSVETMTSLLTEGLVARGHEVTLFATADSKTNAKLCAIYPHGYWHDENMWPWELYEMLNLAAAVERARDFDIIHYEAAYYPMSLAFTRLSPTSIVQTLHHSPSDAEVKPASTSSTPCCTESTPTTSCFARNRRIICSSSAGSPRAKACCRRSKSPSASACV
jgi:hypothetical protein